GTLPAGNGPDAGPIVAAPRASALGELEQGALIPNVLTLTLPATQGPALPTGPDIRSAVPNGGGGLGTGAHGSSPYLHGGGVLILVGGEGDNLVLGSAGRDVLVGGIGSAGHQDEPALQDTAARSRAADGSDTDGPFDHFGALADSNS